MAWRRDARVAEKSTTTGSGSIGLAGAYDGTYRAFSSVCSTNDTFKYVIVSDSGQWERGIGTYSAANTLARTTIKENSSGTTSAIVFTGNLTVFMDDYAPGISVSETAPTAPPPSDGDRWYQSSTGRTFSYLGGIWIDVALGIPYQALSWNFGSASAPTGLSINLGGA